MILKDLREKAGITQFEVCAAIKISIATLNRWENGYTRLPADVVTELAKLYKVKETSILNALKTRKAKA